MKTFWASLTLVWKIAFSIVALILIAAIILLIVKTAKKDKETSNSNSNTPEVAQVYEPSIGTPLPADVNTDSGTTTVATTPVPETKPEVENSGEVAGATTTIEEQLTAPKTGIDPNEPVAYENTSLKFSATLPAGTQVFEKANEVKFIEKNNTLEYFVSVSNSGSETLQTIAAQLQNSPTVNNVKFGTFANLKTIQFDAKGFGQGMAVISNGKIYYILGNSKYFSTLKF